MKQRLRRVRGHRQNPIPGWICTHLQAGPLLVLVHQDGGGTRNPRRRYLPGQVLLPPRARLRNIELRQRNPRTGRPLGGGSAVRSGGGKRRGLNVGVTRLKDAGSRVRFLRVARARARARKGMAHLRLEERFRRKWIKKLDEIGDRGDKAR